MFQSSRLVFEFISGLIRGAGEEEEDNVCLPSIAMSYEINL